MGLLQQYFVVEPGAKMSKKIQNKLHPEMFLPSLIPFLFSPFRFFHFLSFPFPFLFFSFLFFSFLFFSFLFFSFLFLFISFLFFSFLFFPFISFPFLYFIFIFSSPRLFYLFSYYPLQLLYQDLNIREQTRSFKRKTELIFS